MNTTETLILERCATQIAAEAGPGACVVEFGGGHGHNTELLLAAIEALPPAPVRAAHGGRSVVYLPGARTGAMRLDETHALMRRVGEVEADDALLVVATDTAHGAETWSLPRFERLARDAGWAHCQFWSDGQAQCAVHVLERLGAAEHARARPWQ